MRCFSCKKDDLYYRKICWFYFLHILCIISPILVVYSDGIELHQKIRIQICHCRSHPQICKKSLKNHFFQSMSSLRAKFDIDNHQLSMLFHHTKIQQLQLIMIREGNNQFLNDHQKYASWTFGDFHENSRNSCF